MSIHQQRHSSGESAAIADLRAQVSELTGLCHQLIDRRDTATQPHRPGALVLISEKMARLTTQVAALEAAKPPGVQQMREIAKGALDPILDGFAEAHAEQLNALIERVTATEKALAGLQQQITDGLAQASNQHRETAAIAEWQLSAACALLVEEARRFAAAA